MLKKEENDFFDIKQEFYEKSKKYDLIKDVAAFANNCSNRDKYIVFGVDESNWKVCGINRADIPNISDIEQLINSNIDPKLKIKLNFFSLDGKELAILVICKDNVDRPYIIKRTVSYDNGKRLNEGTIYIRNGATNCIATRMDLDLIYNGKCCVNFSLRRKTAVQQYSDIGIISGKRYFIAFEIEINNPCADQYMISTAYLRFSSSDSTILNKKCICSIESLSSKDRFYLDAKHPLKIMPYSSVVRWFNFFLDERIITIISSNNVRYEIIYNENSDEKIFDLNEKLECKK